MRKLMFLIAAISALGTTALSASAASGVTFKEGASTLAVGAKVTATSTNTSIVTSPGTLTCTNVTLNTSVNTNATSPAKLSAGTGTASGCSGFGKFDTVTLIRFEQIAYLDSMSGSSNIRFVYDLSGIASGCFLEGSTTGTWTSGSSKISVKANLTGGGGGLCPTSGTLAGDFFLETTGTTTAVTVNN